MRRYSAVLALSVFLVLGLLAAGRLAGQANAQDPLSIVALGGADIEVLPQGKADLVLYRLTLQPGGVLTQGNANDSGISLVYVESGTLTIRLDTPYRVVRSAASLDKIDAGTETTAGPGDSFAIEPYVSGEIRNDGTEPATWLACVLDPLEDFPSTPAP